MDSKSFNDFVDIMRYLRSEKGCPWDKVQTNESLKKCTIEEAYEVLDAIDKKDYENLCEELGDLLMQVVFHSIIAEEEGRFTLDDVIQKISDKMISRHSHIFGNDTAETPEQVEAQWEINKMKEKKFDTQKDAIKSVPKSLPALMRAQKVLSKAEDFGEYFPSANDTIDEIIKTLDSAKSSYSDFNDDEFGQFLFMSVNLGRKLKLNAEFALTKALETFINRFGHV